MIKIRLFKDTKSSTYRNQLNSKERQENTPFVFINSEKVYLIHES